jgi:hypothetical protein
MLPEYIYTYIYIHIHTYTHIHIYKHTHTHIYIHTYTHTHIHTYILKTTQNGQNNSVAHGFKSLLFSLSLPKRVVKRWNFNSKKGKPHSPLKVAIFLLPIGDMQSPESCRHQAGKTGQKRASTEENKT